MRVALEANRTSWSPDVYTCNWKEYGGTQANPDPNQNRSKNTTIHGLKAVKEDEIMDIKLYMCQAMGVIMHLLILLN